MVPFRRGAWGLLMAAAVLAAGVSGCKEADPSAVVPQILAYQFLTTPAAVGLIGTGGGSEAEPIVIAIGIPPGVAWPPEEEKINVIYTPPSAPLKHDEWSSRAGGGYQRNYDLQGKHYRVDVSESGLLIAGTMTFRWEGDETTVRHESENGYSAYMVSAWIDDAEVGSVRVDQSDARRGAWGPINLDKEAAGKTVSFRVTLKKGSRMGVVSMDYQKTLGGEGSADRGVLLVEKRLPVGVPAELWSINEAYKNYHSAYQICDIDLGYGMDWQPMNNFSGAFNGGGNKIENLNINESGTDNIGLFGTLSGTIKNVNIASGSVSGNRFVGAICGRLVGSISNCSNKASVTGTQYVGGICGIIPDTDGLTGEVKITGCLNEGAVSGGGGSSYIGGIVGHTQYKNAVIYACKNAGDISGDDVVGGITACNEFRVAACYNTGSIAGRTSSTASDQWLGVGGVVGRNYPTPDRECLADLDSCYNLGAVTNTSEHSSHPTGSVVGWNAVGIVQNCFWDASRAVTVNGAPQTPAPAIGDNRRYEDLELSRPTTDPAITFNYPFSASWPTEEMSEYWRVGPGDQDGDGLPDDPDGAGPLAGGWWKSLGTPGTTNYPKLFFEE